MDCFQGTVTSVDTDMAHNGCDYDTGLQNVKVSPDVEQAEVADETVPNTGHLKDEDENTEPHRSDPGRQRRVVIQSRRFDDFVMRDELENQTLHSDALVTSIVHGPRLRLWLTLTGKQRCSESTNL